MEISYLMDPCIRSMAVVAAVIVVIAVIIPSGSSQDLPTL